MRKLLGLVLLACLAFLVPVAAFSQAGGPTGDQRWQEIADGSQHKTAATMAEPSPLPRVGTVPIRPIRLRDGASLYQAYCSSCHGASGRGDGPAVRGLAQPVPDLTRIAQRDGAYQQLHVRLHIADPTMHVGMPDWQSALSSIYSDHVTQLAVYNLERHVEQLQVAK